MSTAERPLYYDALKKDWQTGLLSVRLLRIKYGLRDDAAVHTMAAQHGWGNRGERTKTAIEDAAERHLIDRTVAAAESAIARDGRQEIAQEGGMLVDSSSQIDKFGQVLAHIVGGQRRTAYKGRSIVDKLMDELDSITPPAIDELAIESMAAAVEATHPELAESLRKNPATLDQDTRMRFLGRRIGQLRNLSETAQRFIDIERQVWGLEKTVVPGMGDSMDDVLATLDQEQARIQP